MNNSVKTAVALGFFDGIHLGHQKLIRSAIDYSKQKNIPSVVFTFSNSPKQVLNPDSFQGFITTMQEKHQLIKDLGADEIVSITFDEKFAKTSCESFIQKFLIEKLNAEAVFVGYNFSFGANRSGNAALLSERMSQLKRKCFITKQVKIHDAVISSSAIRAAILEGNVETASTLLGREFNYTGTVEHGDARGRTMGFPTANLPLKDSQKVLPPNGVYACYTDTPYGTFPAVVNMGYRPTFDRDIHLLEAHILDFEKDIYGKEITVRFVKRLRSEIKFGSADSLIEQMNKDRMFARKVL